MSKTPRLVGFITGIPAHIQALKVADLAGKASCFSPEDIFLVGIILGIFSLQIFRQKLF